MILDKQLQLSMAITSAASAGTATSSYSDVIDVQTMKAGLLDVPCKAQMIIDTATALTGAGGTFAGATLKVVWGNKPLSSGNIDVSGTEGTHHGYLYSYTGTSSATKTRHVVDLKALDNLTADVKWIQVVVGQTKQETNSLNACVVLEAPFNSGAKFDR